MSGGDIKYAQEPAVFDSFKETRPPESSSAWKRGEFLITVRGWGVTEPDFQSIIGDAVVTGGTYNRWFETRDERALFYAELNALNAIKDNCGFIIGLDEGPDVKFRTVGVATLREQDGKEYVVEYDYGYGYPWHTVIFDFEENNRSCCHRRRDMVIEQHPDCGLERIDDCEADVPILVIKFEIQYRE